MDAVNTFLTFMMSMLNTVMGWFGSFFGTILPGAGASDDKKAAFVKYGLIVLGLIVVSRVLRVNIGGRGKK